MGALEDIRDEVHALAEKIDAQNAAIAELLEKVHPTRETYTLKQLAELPESPALKTLRSWRYSSPHKLPGGGKPDGFTHDGLQAWRRETVEEWRRALLKHPTSLRGNPNLRRVPA